MAIQPFATQIQPPQIQPVNAMAQVGQLMAMRNAQQENALRDLQMGQLKQGIEQENALRAFLGSGADLSTSEAQRQLLGHGKPGADVLKLLREAESADLTRQKTSLEIADTITKSYRDRLSTLNTDNPEAFLTGFADATNAVHSNPVMKHMFAGTEASAERSIQEAQAAAQAGPEAMRALIARNTMNAQMFQERLKPQLIQVEDLTGQRIVSAAPGQTGATTIATFGPKPRQAGTTVYVGGGKRFGEVLGETAAKRLDDYRAKADSAVSSIESTQNLLPLLDDPKFISGTFAEARTNIARALGMDVSATEAYFAGIGQQVAELITAFGAGTGLSDADRDFAKAIAGGQPITTVEGIKRIIRINNDASNRAISKYNEERNRLGKKEAEVLDYYPEVSSPAPKTVGTSSANDVDTNNPLLK